MADFSRLADFASQHHGLVRASDALQLGHSPQQLARLVARGWLDHPRRGLYRVRGHPVTPAQAVLAFTWGHGPLSVASHRAAAREWSIPGYRSAKPEASKPRGQSHRGSRGQVHGSLWLPPRHRTEHDGIPITTPARTIFDLAGVVHPKAAERALDHVLHTRLCTIEQVQAVFFALARRGRRGTVTMRALLDAMGAQDVPPASALERLARTVIAAAGLPMPAFEVNLGDDHSWIGRVDCLWRAQKVILELDGRRWHGGLLARDADRERDNRLMASGWRVLRVTYDDFRDRPGTVVAWLRAALHADV